MRVTFAFIPFCSQWATVMTVGWGLFQHILRSVPTTQREVEGEPWWFPGVVAAVACTG